MKSKIKYCAFFCLAATILCLSLIHQNINKTDSDINTAGFMYTICEYKGNVAIFSYGENKPKIILDCKINNLPDAVANNVREGIKIYTEDELQYYLEAFD